MDARGPDGDREKERKHVGCSKITNNVKQIADYLSVIRHSVVTILKR